MLQQRAARLAEGDVAGYLEHVTPKARQFERRLALGTKRIPLEGVNIRLRDAVIRRSRDRVRGARADFVYWLRGLPRDNLFHVKLLYDFRKRGGRWVIDGARLDLEEGARPQMWALGKVEVRRSPHFLALYRPGTEGVAQLIDLAEDARARLVRGLGLPHDRRHLLLLAATLDDFSQWTGLPPTRAAVAAARFDYFAAGGSLNLRPENREMIVNLQALVDDPDEPVDYRHARLRDIKPIQVFKHELGHLALSRTTSFYTPGWVTEAGAMILSGERRRREWKLFLDTEALERLTFALLSRDQDLPGFGYPYANAAGLYLVDRRGERTFWDFYKGFWQFDIPEPKGQGAIRIDRTRQLLNLLYGLDTKALDDATRKWMRRAAR